MTKPWAASQERLVQMFEVHWREHGGELFRVREEQSWPHVLNQAWTTLLGDQGGSVVYWVNADVAHLNWENWLRRCGAQAVYGWDAADDMRSRCAQAVLGLTGSQWAVAETGSVALIADADRGLLPSVMPPAHIMLVSTQHLVETVQEGLQQIPGSHGMPPLIKLVTGPSMTADIEGTLVVGVHGPGRVAVILYDTVGTLGADELR